RTSFIRTVRSSPTALNQRRQPPERRINPPEVGIMSVTGSVIAPARTSLWSALNGAGPLSDRALWGAEASVSLGDLVDGGSLGGRLDELRDRSVLVATRDQLTAALAPIELDGLASRLVLCPPDLPALWTTFYDIRRYGGLQIFLRALLGGGSMVLSSARESPGDFLTRAGAHGVTHISGTPSHWRRALMSPSAHRIAPRYVRLSGEIADQAILDHLRACYPDARIAHAFASTEAGVAFDVGDGRAGF